MLGLRDRSVDLPSAAPWIVSGIGLVLAGLSLWFLIVSKAFSFTLTASLDDPALVLRVLEVALLGGFSVVLVYAGYWLATRQFGPEDLWWAGFWTVLGLSGIVGLVALFHSFRIVDGGTVPEPTIIEELLLAAGGGALAGLLIGISTIRSTVNAERASRQRDTLLFVNQLLRHNVLNGMQVILAYADQIEEQVDDEQVQADLATIADRGRTIVDLVDNVRTLMKSVAGETSIHPVRLTSLLVEEVSTARATYPEATFDIDVPDNVEVMADELLEAVVENLLANAVEHNDRVEPRVEVSVEVVGTRAVLRIADDGPGIPDDHKQSYFEAGEQGAESVGQGLGLYLVDTLVEQYGGEVEIRDNDPRGAVFRVGLPLAD